MKNSLLRFVMTCIAVMLTMSTSFAAVGTPTSGTCGDPAGDPGAMTWEFNMITGTLTISGTGEMADFASPSDAPWYAWAYDIKTVKLGEEITHIGDYAFCSIPLMSIQTLRNESRGPRREEAVEEPVPSILPESLNSIGKFALQDTWMTSLTLPSQLVYIGESALAYNSQLTTLTLLGTMTIPWFDASLSDILAGCGNLTAIYVPENCVDDYKNTDCWSLYANLIQAIPEGGGGGDEPSGSRNEVVTIGKASYFHGVPITAQYKYSLSQQIYTADEIGNEAGNIWSLAFNTGKGNLTRNIDVYVTKTSQSGLSSGDFLPVTEADRVYSGELTFTANQWNSLDFQKPFAYDGSSNILITIDDNSGYSSGGWGVLTTGIFYGNGQQCHVAESKNNDLDPMDATTMGNAYDNDAYSYKNQIRLTFATYPSPTGIAVTDISDVSALVQCSLRGDATAWNLRYRQIVAEGEEDYVAVSGITDRSYTIEDLAPATQYEIQVQAVFSEDNFSEWSDPVTFYTSCCPSEEQSELLWSARGYSDCESAFKIVDHETGIEMAYISMANSNAFGGYLNLCCGRTYDVYWVSNKRWPGSDNGCTFTLFFLPGDEFYSMMPGTAPEAPNGEEGTSYLMTSFVMDCTPYCAPMPRFLTATDVGYQGATFTYQATTLKEELQYSTDPTFPENKTTTIEVTRIATESETTYTLTGLETLTIYYVRVRSICDDGAPDNFSRWTKSVQIVTDTKYAPPTRPTADPKDPKTEDIAWKRQGMEGKNNVNYRTAGEGTPAGDPMLIDLDDDGETFESWGGTTYGSYGKKGVDNVIAIANVPANAIVSWYAADANSAKVGGNTVRFTSGFYKQSKKFNEGEETTAQEELTQKLQQQKEEEQEAQQNTGKLQELLEKAKQLEKQIEDEGGMYNLWARNQLNRVREQIQALQPASQTKVVGNTSATPNESTEQSSEARSTRAPESEEGDYYFFFIRHTEPDEILLIKDITITSPENVGDWITIPDVKNVEYALQGLQPGTEYEVMVEPVYDNGLVGIASPITVFTTIGAENTPMEGEFSVSEEKKVQFAKGNLRHIGDMYEGTWSIASQQYDMLGQDNIETYTSGSYTADLVDLFCWSAPKDYYGITFFNGYDDEEAILMFQGDFAEWGANPEVIANLGSGWSTLSKDEWNYLLNERANAANLKALATVNNVKGLVLLPDTWMAGAPASTYTADTWMTMENAGAVFLPAAGQMTSVYDSENWHTTTTVTDDIGVYWSSTPTDASVANAENLAIGLTFQPGQPAMADFSRRTANAVRLVKAVMPKMQLQDSWIAAIADQDCTGSELKPAVTVKDGSTILTEGTDYTAAYTDNVNVGTATVTITAADASDYIGTASATFNIVRDMSSVFSSGNSWATYVAKENLSTPGGLSAYVVSAATATSVTASPVGYIPVGVAILLSRDDVAISTYKGMAYSGTPADNSSMLKGSATSATTITPYKDFVLFGDEFVLSSAATVPAGHAYLPAAIAPAGARSMIIVIGDATDIKSLGSSLKDGWSEYWYTIDGRHLNGQPTTKGVYLLNGNKVVIK